jgi:hypothetical protein
MMKTEKVIVMIEVDIEKPITDLGGEICRRISMHPDVQDANVITVKHFPGDKNGKKS